MAVSYASMALANCLARDFSGTVTRAEGCGAGRADAGFTGADVRLAGRLASLDALLDPLRELTFTRLPFKRRDLACAEGRPLAFLPALGFALAFVAMGPATYTDSASYCQEPMAGDLLLTSQPTRRLAIPTAGGNPSSGDAGACISDT